MLWAAIAHRLWDMYVFPPMRSGAIATINLGIQVLVFILAVITVIVLLKDRRIAVTSEGLRERTET